MLPGLAPGGASAVVTCPQHRQISAGSSHSVTSLLMLTSQTCAHDAPAGCAPASPVPHREHRAGGFRRRPLVRVRVLGKASPGMAGLPAALAVRAALPLRRIPPLPLRLAALLRPDALLRRRRPRISAVLPEPAFQLRDPQLHPPAQLPLGRQLRPQHRDLGILRLDHSPQPGQQLTLPAGTARQIRLIGHNPIMVNLTYRLKLPHVLSRLSRSVDLRGRRPASRAPKSRPERSERKSSPRFGADCVSR